MIGKIILGICIIIAAIIISQPAYATPAWNGIMGLIELCLGLLLPVCIILIVVIAVIVIVFIIMVLKDY